MERKLYNRVTLLLICSVTLFSLTASAQRFFNNPISQYYRDGYLWNPAMAGNAGTRLYGLLNKSWIGFDGAPKQIGFAGDMKLNEKTGVGLQLTSDKSGVFQRYMGALSYAYKISFSETSNLRLGGNMSFYNERIDSKALVDEGQVDLTGTQFNEKSMEFNGDLGVAYESGNISIGATAYNLGTHLDKSDEKSADLAMGQAVASVKLQCEDERINIRPMIAYKLFYKHTNIFTAATQVEFDQVFHAGIYWQSTGNMMGGVGLMYKQLGEVNFFYSGKNKYGTNQQFEVGLKLKIQK